MPITIYPGSMKKRNANGSYSDLVPAIATDPEVLDDFAEEYSTSETYNIGDYCIHNSDLYKCNTNNTTGTWNNNAWDRVTVADELVDHKNTLDQLGEGLAYPVSGDTNTTGARIDKGVFVYLTEHSSLPDGIYRVISNINSGSAYTSSNLEKQSKDSNNSNYGALSTLGTVKWNTSSAGFSWCRMGNGLIFAHIKAMFTSGTTKNTLYPNSYYALGNYNISDIPFTRQDVMAYADLEGAFMANLLLRAEVVWDHSVVNWAIFTDNPSTSWEGDIYLVGF